ncbi:hypothetical protein PRZ48_011541 [Zasmidium cellare]|uniref:Uncharacterized protein n=1 Tax=Zasmidium cellare TaxID=395010 RepID=A0ABR0E7A0_ZASCE|nr:hypothetical protein PRZ48_011541 [Zasmidium cellare]
MITYNWVETQDYPFPDFAINKKCMKHDKLLQWQAKNQLSQEQWVEMSVRGPGSEEPILPMPEQLRKWSEKEDEERHQSMAA